MKKFGFILATVAAVAVQGGGLENGGVWRDTDGVHINAHGGGLLRDGDVWYWYGEHKVEGKVGNRAQVGVGCYSSKDLLAWKNEGIALAVSEAPGYDIEKDCILERPKVVKAPATGKYVMMFHLERKGKGYGDARVGFAVADRPTGLFEFKYSCRPLGAMSRDMTVFVDDDGSVWHIFASEQNSTLHFAELNGDCLGYSGRWHKAAVKEWTEAPAIIKHGGWYWLLGSGCTGWKPNAARMYRARSLAGPWEWLGNPCTGVNRANMLGADKTWGGQSTYIFHDEKTGRDIACFDIWQPSNAIDGRYVWLPITWHGDGLPEIPWRGEWSANDRDDLTLRGGPNSIWGVYQWGVEVDGFVHKETKKPARAYLWIPPGTKRVKAVVIGNDNMLEEPLFSDADFRRTLAAADIAIVFVTPGLMGFNEKFTEAEVPALDALLAKLAKASGHSELAKDAKVVPLGHSAWADWPYLCTAAMPRRVKCAVSLKGSWPHFKPQFDDAFWKKTEGVLMLLVGGDYEWFSERIEKDKGFLKSHPDVKLYPVADWESGHFDMTDALPLAIARFIADGTVLKIPRFGGKFTVLGYEGREGEVVSQDPKNHLQVTVPFQPKGEGFRAKARYEDTVPLGRPERWTGKKAGEPNGRPELPASAIDVKVIQGPAVKAGPDTFDIRFNRHGFDGYRAREVVLAAVYPGDAHWKRSVQQAILRFPKNTHGAENVIEWNLPKTATVADFPLVMGAKATSGLPVRYYVREGPAVVGDDGIVHLCDWPLGAKECDITICAYQWGADGGKVKSAEPVFKTIRVSSGGVSVSLMSSPFAENMKRERAVMMSIEPGNLTWMFRVTAGLDSLSNTNGVLRLGGWEAPGVELRGHTCGHWLSGMANVIHARREEAFRRLSPLPEEHAAAEVVHQLRLCQDAIGTGYVSAFPESFIDRVIARKKVWAPWYTLHKILAGLIDQYTLAGNDEALLVARRFGDWAYARLSPLSESDLAQMRHNEFGGIGEALRSLYAITKDPRHAKAADAFDDPTVLDALDRREDAFAPKHCNTYLPKMLADLRRYELFRGDKALARVKYFFERALNHHMYAAGCFSDKEHWFSPDTQGAHLTGVTGESCCTYNMLKLARRLFALEPRIETADYIERAIYNHILAQQEPMEGRVTYFMPMMTGSYKLRNRANDAFWCCVGSAMESQTGFADYIAQESGNALYINLFIPSRINWRGFTFELSETSLKCVSAVADASSPAIYIREPRRGYRKVVRDWKPGDEIDVGEKWAFRMETLPDDPSHAALFYGPWLLGGCLGVEGMRKDATRSLNYYEHDYTVPEHLRDIVLGDPAKIVPVIEDFDKREYAKERELAYLNAPVVFRNEGGVVLKPLAWINGERWVVYWRIGQ